MLVITTLCWFLEENIIVSALYGNIVPIVPIYLFVWEINEWYMWINLIFIQLWRRLKNEHLPHFKFLYLLIFCILENFDTFWVRCQEKCFAPTSLSAWRTNIIKANKIGETRAWDLCQNGPSAHIQSGVLKGETNWYFTFVERWW